MPGSALLVESSGPADWSPPAARADNRFGCCLESPFLTDEERQELERLTRLGKTESRKYIHARALLLRDAGAGGPAWHVCNVAEALGVSGRAIEKLKKRFVEEGLRTCIQP